VRSFGVFVDLGGADGLAHLSELTWDRDKSPADLFHVGDEVDVYITKIDAENKKIALSLRRAKPEQWDNVVDKYQDGQVVTGLITKLVTFGAFARIEGPVEGLIHVSELVDRRIGHPREVVREGDLLPLKIVRIERDRHRLGLSLRRARDEGEAMGYVFSEGGEVLSVPAAIRAEFEEREGPLPAPAPDERDALIAEGSEGAFTEASEAEQPPALASEAPFAEASPPGEAPALAAKVSIEEAPIGAMEAAFAEATAVAETAAPPAEASSAMTAMQEDPLSDVAAPEELEETTVPVEPDEQRAEEPVPQEVDEITAG